MREDDAGERGDEAGVFELDLGEGERGAGGLDARPCSGDGVFARAFLGEFQRFGGSGGFGLGDGAGGLGGFEFAGSDHAALAELAAAGLFQAGAVAVGLGAAQRGACGGEFLGARAGFDVGEGGLGGGEFGAAELDLLALLDVVEPGDELAGGDALSLGDEALGDAAGNLKPELGVGGLDVA